MPRADVALINEVLAEYSAMSQTWMGRYLRPREPKEYLYDLAAEYPKRSGRGLRPSLCIANAKAVGGEEQSAILSAVSIELMHNASLIHDDIEDESELRRGKPTLNASHGVPLAINAGDMLMTLAMEPLLDNASSLGPKLAFDVLREFGGVARETAEGQAMELGWRRDNVLDLCASDYHKMVFKKTSWLTIVHPLRVGALVGGRGALDLTPFIRLGYFIGSAFQIQDDVLNLQGDLATYGKEIAGDLAEGKRSLMIIRLAHCLPDTELAELRRLLGASREERAASADWIMCRLQKYKCIEYASEVSHSHAGAACYEFDKIYGGLEDSREKRFIQNLIFWVLERQ